MRNNLENQLQIAINHNDFDINYHNGIAKNHWGQEYSVNIERTDSCFDLSSVSIPNRDIILKEPCELISHNDPGIQMAQTLAHELGHTDVYPASLAILLTLGLIGTGIAIKNKCPKTFGYTAMAVLGYKMIIDEILAEVAATKFHGASFNNYMSTKGTFDFLDTISGLF